jgi:hypothetical protein
MKISSETITILKNFATINEGTMRFNQGNVLRTSCPAISIVAEATVEEVFPKEFVIEDMNMMLGVLDLFQDPDVIIGEKGLQIKGGGNQSLTYLYASDSMAMKSGKIRESEPFVEFQLGKDQFKTLLSATDTLKIEHVVFSSEGNGSPIRVSCENVKNPGDNFEIIIDDVKCDKQFRSVHNRKNLKIVSGDYTISCTDRYSKFHNANNNLSYWITLDAGLSEV